MQFICKRCGKKKEIRLFSKDILRCWCEECGASIPNGKRYGLLEIGMYLLLFLFLGYWKQSDDISLVAFLFVFGILSVLIWVGGIFLGGLGNWYGDDADYLKERESKNPVSCQECGRTLDIPVSIFFGNGQIRCPQCHKQFSFRDMEQMSSISVFADIVAFILILVVGKWYIVSEEGLLKVFFSNAMWISLSFRIMLLGLFSAVVHLMMMKMLCFVYHKKTTKKEEDSSLRSE